MQLSQKNLKVTRTNTTLTKPNIFKYNRQLVINSNIAKYNSLKSNISHPSILC